MVKMKNLFSNILLFSTILLFSFLNSLGCNENPGSQVDNKDEYSKKGHIYWSYDSRYIEGGTYNQGFILVWDLSGWSASYFDFHGTAEPSNGYYISVEFNSEVYKAYLIEFEPYSITVFAVDRVIYIPFNDIIEFTFLERLL